MFAVVLHANGRIDGEHIASLAARSMLVFRSTNKPALYAILGLHETLQGTLDRAAELRANVRSNAQLEMDDKEFQG